MMQYKKSNFTETQIVNAIQEHKADGKAEDIFQEMGISSSAFYNGSSSNTIGFREMGIGNTSNASALMSVLCNISIEQCIGKGTGVANEQLIKKQNILKTAIANYNGEKDILSLMAYFGGFEILQIAGAILEAV